MAALPYMQIYWSDYFADTPHLTTEEHGAYLLLIGAYWNRGKPIPIKQLPSISKLNERWTDVEPTLNEFFTVDQSGCWRHERIEMELEKVRTKSTKASAAGKASAKKRRKKQLGGNERSTDVESELQLGGNHTDTDTDTDTDTETYNIKEQQSKNPWLCRLVEKHGYPPDGFFTPRNEQVDDLWTASSVTENELDAAVEKSRISSGEEHPPLNYLTKTVKSGRHQLPGSQKINGANHYDAVGPRQIESPQLTEEQKRIHEQRAIADMEKYRDSSA